MDSNTIIATLIGAGIATLPILISNIVQIILHISERQQKEREARIQAWEKVFGGDIDKAMDLIDRLMKAMSEFRAYDDRKNKRKAKKDRGYISEEEYEEEAKLDCMQFDDKKEEGAKLYDAVCMNVYSFDKEIASKYEDFVSYTSEYLNSWNEGVDADTKTKAWGDLLASAGRLRQILRQRKMKIYDSLN